MLHEVGAVLRPKVHTVETGFDYWYADNYQDMVSALVKDKGRNELIAGCIDRGGQAWPGAGYIRPGGTPEGTGGVVWP